MTLLSKGYTQRQIAAEMHLSMGKINQVVQELKAQARENLHEFVSKTLPEEMELSLVRLNNIIKELHKDLDNPNMSKRDRYNAMALINQCTQLKLEILGSGVLANQLNQQQSISDKCLSQTETKKETQNNKDETSTVSQ